MALPGAEIKVDTATRKMALVCLVNLRGCGLLVPKESKPLFCLEQHTSIHDNRFGWSSVHGIPGKCARSSASGGLPSTESRENVLAAPPCKACSASDGRFERPWGFAKDRTVMRVPWRVTSRG